MWESGPPLDRGPTHPTHPSLFNAVHYAALHGCWWSVNASGITRMGRMGNGECGMENGEWKTRMREGMGI